MTALTDQYIDLSYKDVLQVSNSNSGIDGTLRTISDGEGTSSALQISTSTVNINGTFKLNGTTFDSTSLNLLTLANTFNTSGNYAVTQTYTGITNVTLPTTGTLATLAGAETFTNKTLTTPIIATISNTGTLTLPISTDTLVGRATTDTLSNKTLVTPVLGAATATSINKLVITAPATSSTLTIVDGKTLTASNTLTLTGTDSSSVAFGAGGTVMYTNTALTAAQYLSGSVVQRVSVMDGTTTGLSNVIPADNSIPQNTEGTELVTLSITPKNASNILTIEATFPCSANGNVYAIMALFQDSNVNAVSTVAQIINGADLFTTVKLGYRMLAGTTSATTFKLRVGPNSGTLSPNGNSTFNFGGTMKTLFTITESVA